MKIKTLWLSSHGFSLVEIMAAVALMGVLSLITADMTTKSMKGSKTLESKMAISSEVTGIKQVLTGVDSCTATFGGQLITVLPRSVTNVVRSVKGVNTNKWIVNKTYSNLKLISVKITSWTPDPGNTLLGDLVTQITWQKLGTTFGEANVINSINMRATINSSNVIQDCKSSYGSGTSDDLWQVHADGIYYNQATAPAMSILTQPVVSPNLLQVYGNAVIGANASISTATCDVLLGICTNNYGLAIGEWALASGKSSIAIGGAANATNATEATNSGSIALGSSEIASPDATAAANNKGAVASGFTSIAIGGATYETALVYFSTKWLPGAYAPGGESLAMGAGSKTSDNRSVAIGFQSITGRDSTARINGVAVGFSAFANDTQTTAVGFKASAGQVGTSDGNVDNSGALAIGSNSNAYDMNSIAIGASSIAGQSGENPAAVPAPLPLEGDNAIAIGYGANSYDKETIAIGHGAIAGNSTLGTTYNESIAIGAAAAGSPAAVASAYKAIAIGSSARGRGIQGVAIGNKADSGTADASIAIGAYATSGFVYGIALGIGADVQDDWGIAIGGLASAAAGATNSGPVAIGMNARSIGGGVAIGANSKISTDGLGVAIGNSANAAARDSVAINGIISSTSSSNSIVIGKGGNITSAVTNSMLIAPNPLDAINVASSNLFVAHFSDGFDFMTGSLADPTDQGWRVGKDGTPNTFSDVHMKQDIVAVDAEKFVDRFFDLNIFWWNYIARPEPEYREIGAMAQDFKRAFGTFGDGKHITQVDADGVLMAGIRGLAIRNKKLAKRIDQLDYQTPEIEERLNKLETVLAEKLK